MHRMGLCKPLDTAMATMLRFDHFPRADLCHRPTPLEPMPRLSAHFGGPDLWIKRDDCTGLATGGNKTRKLEFLVGEALAQDADMLITQGAVQSNHVRQTAAAACRAGLACHALLERRVPNTNDDYELTGNVFLDRLLGASVEFRGPGLDMNAEAREVAAKFAKNGKKPYFIPGGGSNPTGALGYAECAQELVQDSRLDRIDWIVMATGSTGTQAGLVAGLHAMGDRTPVLGVSVRQPADAQIKAVHDLAVKTCEKLGVEPVPQERVLVDDTQVGAGYGIPAESTMEAIFLAARWEGLLLDPVYSGKGFAGMIDRVRHGFFGVGETVVFLHTGGAAALFAYQDALMGMNDSQSNGVSRAI